MGTSTAKLKLYRPATTGEAVSVQAAINDNMDKLESLLPMTECTSGARPASPFLCQTIFETDTKATYFWNGTKWVAQPNEFTSPVAQTGSRNILHNGNMLVSQRGNTGAGSTGSTNTTKNGIDRWNCYRNSVVAGSTWTRDTNTGLANFPYGLLYQRDSGNTATNLLTVVQGIESEDVYHRRGKVLTLSFWARAGANYSAAASALAIAVKSGTTVDENIHVGTYTGGTTDLSQTATLTTSWQKFTYTFNGFQSGAKAARVEFNFTPVGTAGANDWFEITGVQLEEGSVATPFEHVTAQQQLAMCQRFFWRLGGVGSYPSWATGKADSTTVGIVPIRMPVSMRATPLLAVTPGNWLLVNATGAGTACTVINIALGNQDFSGLSCTIGSAALVAGHATNLVGNNTTAAIMDFSAEL